MEVLSYGVGIEFGSFRERALGCDFSFSSFSRRRCRGNGSG